MLYARRSGGLVTSIRFCFHASCRSLSRIRFGRVPSGSYTDCSICVRRSQRIGSIGLSGRRKRRHGFGAARGRFRCDSLRAGKHCLVWNCRGLSCNRNVEGRHIGGCSAKAAVTTSPSKSSAKLDQSVTCRALRGSLLVDVLQTGLHCLPTELSDVLFNRHIRHDHIGQPIRAFRLSGDERYRDNRRRPADRSLRQPCRHSLFDTRRRTVHAHDSSRRTSDIRLFGSGRVVHHVIGLFRHSRLCA